MPIFNWNFFHQSNPQDHLAHFGMRIAVEIGLHPEVEQLLISTEAPVPGKVSGTGIIDTGATRTSIDLSVANELGLVPMGATKVRTAQGALDAPVYPFAITLAPNLTFPAFGMGCNLHEQGIHALIGMDLISRCIFLVNGPAGMFSLAT